MKLHMTGVMDYNRMLYNTDLLKLTGRAVCPQVDLSVGKVVIIINRLSILFIF